MTAPGRQPRLAFVENLSIQVKAFAASAVLMVSLGLLGVVAYVTLDRTQEGLRNLSTTALPKQQAFAAVKDAVVAVQMKVFRFVSWASNGVNDNLLTALNGEIESNVLAIGRDLDSLANRADLTPVQKADLFNLVANWKAYQSSARDTLDVGSTDAPMATMMLGQADEKFVALALGFQQMSDSVVARTNEASADLTTDAEQKKLILLFGAVAGLTLSVVVSVLVSRSIVKPIRSVTEAMRQLSAGNTEVAVGYQDRRDEIGQMVGAIQVFRTNAIEMRALEVESLEAEKKSMREIAEARERLSDAIESISEGFCLYDAEDRLVLFNSKYKKLFAAYSDLVVVGASFESIVRTSYERGMIEDGGPDQATWLEQRIQQHRADTSTHTQHRSDGRWILISERRTAGGGVVATYADITELKQREVELARLVQGLQEATAELTQSLEQQTATSEVLRVISSSTADTQPVFDMIAERAMHLCDSHFCAVFRFDGELIHLVAHHGLSAEGAASYARGFPLPPSRISAIGRAVQERAAVQIPDVENDPEYGISDVARAVTFRAILAVPLLHEGVPIGGIAVSRTATGLFPSRHVDLLNIFADQAVVAIKNVRVFRELESRTQELTRSSEQLASAHAEVTALNARLHSENTRMGAELDVTRRLQLMLLPSAQELRGVEGLDIAGFMQPADEVGGDYYDVLVHDGRVKIGMGDVTGHGLESGVVVVMTQAIVRALMISGETDPVRFLDVLNRTMHGNVQRMHSDKNLSLCLLDYAAGEVRLSGQHEELIVVRRNGSVELLKTIDLGFPVGMLPDIAGFVGQASVRLQPGDGVVLYTDGITEAENPAREQYGLGRLCAVLQAHWAGSAETIKEAVVSDVKRYIGPQTVYDDITLLVAKQT